jgi:hypothetical protein
MRFLEGTLDVLTEPTRPVVHFDALVRNLGRRTLSGA